MIDRWAMVWRARPSMRGSLCDNSFGLCVSSLTKSQAHLLCPAATLSQDLRSHTTGLHKGAEEPQAQLLTRKLCLRAWPGRRDRLASLETGFRSKRCAGGTPHIADRTNSGTLFRTTRPSILCAEYGCGATRSSLAACSRKLAEGPCIVASKPPPAARSGNGCCRKPSERRPHRLVDWERPHARNQRRLEFPAPKAPSLDRMCCHPTRFSPHSPPRDHIWTNIDAAGILRRDATEI